MAYDYLSDTRGREQINRRGVGLLNPILRKSESPESII